MEKSIIQVVNMAPVLATKSSVLNENYAATGFLFNCNGIKKPDGQ